MSVLTRLWKEYDFLQIKNRNPWFMTLLGNSKTLTQEMCDALYDIRPLLTQYSVGFPGDDEPTTIFAADDASLWQFIDMEYTVNPSYIDKVIITRTPIEIPHARRNPL